MKRAGSWRFCLAVLLVSGFISAASDSSLEPIYIVGLFGEGEQRQEAGFLQAVRTVNCDERLLPGRQLRGLVQRALPLNSSFQVTRRVCSAVERGVAAVIGPQSPAAAAHVQSLCDALELPHLGTTWDHRPGREDYSINLHPDTRTLSKAYVALIRRWHWSEFSVLYEDAAGLARLQEVLRTSTPAEFSISIYQLPLHSGDFRSGRPSNG
ncbi:Glutamate receptor ionotropic, kainate 1 [Amphibalanus amphitrite]|uniref:Glutamate receptor ionotropic, kainate 1 n=1 Tax=Amphibalanus amphitrite TaxID=1232801 RepID=A0A6A4WAZ0_AMPAM|nr:Glutamate receptor ionotropic, kainate 1 [Amphibalanus amphitrite]